MLLELGLCWSVETFMSGSGLVVEIDKNCVMFGGVCDGGFR